MRFAIQALIVFGIVLSPSMTYKAVATDKPEWTYKLSEPVVWNQVADMGNLLVGTKKALSCFDPETGEVLWKRDDIVKSAPFNVREVPGTPILLINDYTGALGTKSKLTAINVITGDTIWETEKFPGYSIGAFPVQSKNMTVMFFMGWSEESGSGIIMRAYQLDTGTKLWETKFSKQGAMPLHTADITGKFFVKVDLSGHQEPVVEGDNFYVPFIGVHCFDLNIWYT